MAKRKTNTNNLLNFSEKGTNNTKKITGKKNYYSKNKLESKIATKQITPDKSVQKRLVNNLYVHSGIYNFIPIANSYEANMPWAKIKKQIDAMMNRAIKNSKKIENKYYQMRGVGKNDFEKSFYLSSFGEKVWDSLSLEALQEDILNDSDFKYVEGTGQTVSKKDFEEKIQKVINKRLEDLDGDYKDIYSELFQKFSKQNFISSSIKEKVFLDTFKNKPTYAIPASSYKGLVGEFSTLLDSLLTKKISGSDSEILNEFLNFENQGVKKVARGGKVDISLGDIGFSVKNYSEDSLKKFGISLHSGKNLEGMFQNDFNEILGANYLNLDNIFKDNKKNRNSKTFTSTEIENFLKYLFVNIYAFSTSGGWERKYNKNGKATYTYTPSIDLFDDFIFVKEFIRFSFIFWIGAKVLDTFEVKNGNNNSVSFFIINKKIIPVSSLIEAVKKNLDTVKLTLPTGKAVFNPNVLKTLKKKELKKQLTGKKTKTKTKYRYPENLVKVGASAGDAIMENVRFKIKMDLDLNSF